MHSERAVCAGTYWRKQKDDGTKVSALIKSDAVQKDGARLMLVAVAVKQRAICHHHYSHRNHTDLQLLTIRQMMAELAQEIFEGKCKEADVKVRKEELAKVRLEISSGSSASSGPSTGGPMEPAPTTPIKRPRIEKAMQEPEKKPKIEKAMQPDDEEEDEMPTSLLDTIPDFG